MSDDRLITLAIHTYEKAVFLKNILEREGVKVVLNNVNLSSPSVSSGVRVRINERDLPLALRIVENQELFIEQKGDLQSTILVPIDFSNYSYKATLTAFNFAKYTKSNIEFLHSYLDITPIDKFQYGGEFTPSDEEFDSQEVAQQQFRLFLEKLKKLIKSGEIPPIKFSTKLVEGVPEDSIIECAKGIKPQLIIMGTRGISKKEKELVGSVTGEVLDACQFPVIAVPEGVDSFDFNKIKHIVFFCNIEHEDIVAFDMFYRLFPDRLFDITIVCVPHKTLRVVDKYTSSQDELLKYCKNNYPKFNFEIQTLSLNNTTTFFRNIERNSHIDMVVVPNKKKNVFSRFFNPSLAHKILLHSDIPMMTIPIS